MRTRRYNRPMYRGMTNERREYLLTTFKAAGVSAVQVALSNPASSPMFGVPEFEGARDLAYEWVDGELKSGGRRRHRNDALLIVGTIAAIFAALFSGYVLLK